MEINSSIKGKEENRIKQNIRYIIDEIEKDKAFTNNDKWSKIEKKINVDVLEELINNYEEESIKNINNYGSTIIHEIKNTLLIKRDFLQTTSVFYDKSTKSFLFIFRSFDNPQYSYATSSNVRGVSYGVTCVSDLTSKSCRYNSVFLVNLGGYLDNNLFSSSILVKSSVAKHIIQSINKINSIISVTSSLNSNHCDQSFLIRPLIDQLISCQS